MKVSHETGSEANFGFGRALMPSYLEMCPPTAEFFSFRMQPLNDVVEVVVGFVKYEPNSSQLKKTKT